MTILAGTILHVGGQNIIDRLQSAGLGNTKMPMELIREVGNLNIVDKVPGEPDFTFTMESFDVSTEIEAWLTGSVGGGTPTTAPGINDANGTEYPIDAAHCQFVNILSPWRNPGSGASGTVQAGVIVPGYYPTRLSYKFGVKENSSEQVELMGGSFYFNENAPVEEYKTGDNATVAFSTASAAASYREFGVGGSTFRSIFGVCVDGVLMTKNIDYTESPTNNASPHTATITFTTAPATGAKIKFCYFTNVAQSYPTALNSSAVVKPAAVRGRNVCVFLGSGGAAAQLGAVQSASLEYRCNGQVERELCSYEIVGYTVLQTDVTGSVVIRARDITQLYSILHKITGLDTSEVYGWLNVNPIPMSIKIQNPKNPGGTYLKTLYVSDAMFDMPDADSKVNQPMDFTINFQSQTGTFAVYKGDSGF